MTSSRPRTPWAHIISQAKLEQQKEGFAQPVECRLKGVTFHNDITGESRQELLQLASTSDPVLCVKEPDNPVDPFAVRVLGPKGQLGYIPADETHHFEHQCTPGYLLWAAAAQHVPDANHGAVAECMPRMRAVYIQPLPTELVSAADLSCTLAPDVWQCIETLQLESTFGRCQLTGLKAVPLNPSKEDSPPVPAAVQPIWSVQERHRIVKLEGFATLCMPAILALNYLDLEVLSQPSSPAPSSVRHQGATDSAMVSGPDSPDASSDAAPELASAASAGTSRADGVAASATTRLGVCGKLLQDLEREFGSEWHLPLARVAAQDALRFGNATFDTHVADPQIQQRQIWSEEDVEGFVALAWHTQERIKNRGFALDVSYLHQLGIPLGGISTHSTMEDLRKIHLVSPQ